MYILVTYDVNTEEKEGKKRLYRVARMCKDYGCRVQNSVFECTVTEVQFLELKAKLEKLIDTKNDSIRMYYLNRNDNRRIVTLGKDTSIDVEGTIIL